MRMNWQCFCVKLLPFTLSLLTGCLWDMVYHGHVHGASFPWHSHRMLLHKHLCHFLSYPCTMEMLQRCFLYLELNMCSPTSRRSWNYHVRLFSWLTLGTIVAHASGLVVVFVLATVGVFSTGRVHQGDLSPENIPKHCHFHYLHPPHLAPSPCPGAVAQEATGSARHHESPLKLKTEVVPLHRLKADSFQQPGPSKSFSEHWCSCLLAHLLLKILKAVIPDLLTLMPLVQQMPEFAPSPLPALTSLHKCYCKGHLQQSETTHCLEPQPW